MNRWDKETKPTPHSPSWVEEVFTYHPPTQEQQEAYVEIRAAAKKLAETIIVCASSCADRAAALRLLRECVMTANAAVALDGLV